MDAFTTTTGDRMPEILTFAFTAIINLFSLFLGYQWGYYSKHKEKLREVEKMLDDVDAMRIDFLATIKERTKLNEEYAKFMKISEKSWEERGLK